MKCLGFFVASIFFLQLCYAQNIEKKKAAIDKLVEKIDADHSRTFSFSAKKKNRVYHYTYQLKNGNAIKIQRWSSNKSDSTIQSFYFNNTALIFASEYITSFYYNNGQREPVLWGGSYHFANNKMIGIITLGHGKSETEGWDAEKEVLQYCKQAKLVVAADRKKRNIFPPVL
jgi:hypothetical protein